MSSMFHQFCMCELCFKARNMKQMGFNYLNALNSQQHELELNGVYEDLDFNQDIVFAVEEIRKAINCLYN